MRPNAILRDDALNGQERNSLPRKKTGTDNLGLEKKIYYKAIIGSKNLNKYLPHFLEFDNSGKTTASWHWPAFAGTFYWLIYRKMWGYWILYGLLAFAANVASRISDNLATPLLLSLLVILMFVLPAMYAIPVYYHHSNEEILKAKEKFKTQKEQLDWLSSRGGTSILAYVFLSLTLIGILAIAILLYTNHRTKGIDAQQHVKHADSIAGRNFTLKNIEAERIKTQTKKTIEIDRTRTPLAKKHPENNQKNVVNNPLITIDFKDMNILKFFSLMGKTFSLKIVLDKNIPPMHITEKFTDMPAIEVFRKILQKHGLQANAINNIIYVHPNGYIKGMSPHAVMAVFGKRCNFAANGLGRVSMYCGNTNLHFENNKLVSW